MNSLKSRACRYATLVLAAAQLSCGGASEHVETHATLPDPNLPPIDTFGPVVNEAELGLSATFRDLTLARSSTSRAADGPSIACAIRRVDDHIVLQADWTPAITPLVLADSPPEGMPTPSTLMLLTRWGASGTKLPGTTVVAGLDGTQPKRHSAIVLLDKSGAASLYIGDELRSAGTLSNPIQLQHVPDLLYVAAYGDTKLEPVVELLTTLQHAGIAAALATILPDDTRIPTVDPRQERAGLCSAEAPPDSDDADHDMTLLAERLRAKSDALSQCVQAHPAHFQEGGAMQVQLTLDARGNLTQACVSEDTTDAPALRQCVLEQYRDLSTQASRGQITVSVDVPFGASQMDTTPLCGP